MKVCISWSYIPRFAEEVHVESKFVMQNFKQKTLEHRASANIVRCPGSVLLNGWPRNLMLLVKRTPTGNIEPPNWDVCKLLLLLSGINQATTNPKVGVCFWCPKHQQYFQLKEWCFCLLRMTFNPSTNPCHRKSSKHFNDQRLAVKLVLVMSLIFFYIFCTPIPVYSMCFPDFSGLFCWLKAASVWSFTDVVGWVRFGPRRSVALPRYPAHCVLQWGKIWESSWCYVTIASFSLKDVR